MRNSIRHALLVVAALSVAISIAFTSTTTRAAENAAPAPEASDVEREIEELVDKVYPAFVLIGGGSGVCISPDGYMVTNHHVAPGAVARYDGDGKEVSFLVTLAGTDRELTAKPVGGDPRGDIVLLKIESDEPLPFAPLADSDKTRVGDIAVAVGNPFLLSGAGSEPSVSYGVVSATDRYQGGYSNCFQVDAPVNPGNSGGPSFNIDGEIIGINGRILTRHGQRYNTGAGFVIPANQIKRFIEDMKRQPGGSIVSRHGLVAGLAIAFDDRLIGCKVLSVEDGSTAQTAGFESGDLITHVDGYQIDGWRGFFGKTQTWPLGSELEFVVQRSDTLVKIAARLDVPVVLNQMPLLPFADDREQNAFIFQGAGELTNGPAMNMFPVPAPSAKLGLRLVPTSGGLKVAGFDSDAGLSEGDASNVLESGDIVTHVAKRPVHYPAEIADCLLGYKPGEKLELTYRRNGASSTVEVILR